MNRNAFIISVSFLSLFASDVMSGLTTTYSCESLGYTVPYDECIAQSGTPLICPFYSFNDKMTICLSQSCRGYGLTEDDLNALSSDSTDENPKTIREHIKELEECETGFGNDKVKYYRVKQCKEGSLYQNGICEVGCLAARYPFDKHPGDLAGEVEDCVDASGTWYGYWDCNSGWDGGWKNTVSTTNPTGYCNLGVCNIEEYPYSRDPNISVSGEDVNRGATLTCKIGSNTYYKYTNKDKDGNPLSENFCGLSSDDNLKNYTLSLGACRGQCVFENCTSTVKNESLSGYDFSYNEFTCTQKTRDCRIGDMAVFEGVEAGVIVHLPENSSDKLRIAAMSKTLGKYCIGNKCSNSTPLYGSEWKKIYGKHNTKFLLKYEEEQNKTLSGNEKFDFQVAKQVNAYEPKGCENIPVCKAGEWYHHAIDEIMFIYDKRYLLSNAVGNVSFGQGVWGSSTDGSSIYSTVAYLSGTSWNGQLVVLANKGENKHYAPMMSIYVR